jgi:hypothetical protein
VPSARALSETGFFGLPSTAFRESQDRSRAGERSDSLYPAT